MATREVSGLEGDDQLPAWALWSSLAVLVAAALAFRLHGLGHLGLLVDEGNQALAIAGVLEHGLPIVESGGLYARNLLFLYLQAGTAALLELDEYSLRLPSALFGTASVVSAFALARSLFGDRVALLTAALVCSSIWEISLARYARPYTALQFLYTLGLLCFFRGYLLHSRSARFGFFACVVAAFPLHEFSVILATCFAIPLLQGEAVPLRRKLVGLATAGGIGVAWVAYQRGAEALLGSLAPPHGLEHVAPAAIAQTGASWAWWAGPRIWLPDATAFYSLWADQPFWLAVPVIVAGAASAILVRRCFAGQWQRAPLLVAMVWAACFHTLGLALLFGLADLVLFARPAAILDRRILPAWIGAGVCLAFWAAVLVPRSSDWKEPVLVMFGYPNVLQQFFYFLATGWPVLLIGVGAGCAVLGLRLLNDRFRPVAPFVLGALLVPIVATSFFRSFFEARYLFHLFPLLLAIYAFAAVRLADALAGRLPDRLRPTCVAAVCLFALIATQEASPAAAWAVGARDYATQIDPAKSVISWSAYAGFHQDHKTPSLYVRERLGPQDIVVALGPPHMIGVYQHYLGKIDYAVGRSQDAGYTRRRGDQIVGWVTGTPIVSDPVRVEELLESREAGATWLVGDHVLLRDGSAYYDERVREILREVAESPDYLGRDGVTFAVRVQ